MESCTKSTFTSSYCVCGIPVRLDVMEDDHCARFSRMQAFDEHMNMMLGEVEESHTLNDRDPVTGEEIMQVSRMILDIVLFLLPLCLRLRQTMATSLRMVPFPPRAWFPHP